VIRGGSWNNNARNVRCAYRNQNSPEIRNNNLGFRLVRAHDLAWKGLPEQTGFQSCGRLTVGKNEVAAGVLVGVCRSEPSTFAGRLF